MVQPEPAAATTADRARYLELLRAHGRDAVSFQGLESGIRYFFTEDGAVAYCDTGAAWVAAGAPVAPREAVSRLARAFRGQAEASGRRACFFGVEGHVLGDAERYVEIGRQPLMTSESWANAKKTHRKLREQLRRARAKGVRARRVQADELVAGSALRGEVEGLERLWLATRPMPAMGFLVSVEPFLFPEEHRYFVAEQGGRAVLFMSLVPIYAAGGWLVEDVLRDPHAPNGTAELVFDAVLSSADPSESFTQGLAPLTGDVPRWLRLVRDASAPFYNFEGLRAFKERLHPRSWEPVYLALPSDANLIVTLRDVLTAFARGSLVAFGARAVLRNPSGIAWALGIPLVPWTALLAVLVAFDLGAWMGWARAPLAGWTLFDALLAVLMLSVARAPRRSSMAFLASLAFVDAFLSILHIRNAGLGRGPIEGTLRVLACAAPAFATLTLAFGAHLARSRAAATRALA